MRSRDLISALRTTDALPWSVARYGRELRVGDRVYYWQAGPDAGIYGVGQIDAVGQRGSDGRYEVRTVHEQALFAPIARSDLRGDPALRGLAVLRQPRGTVFPLTPEQDWALRRRTGAGAGAVLVVVPAARFVARTRTVRLTPADGVDRDVVGRVEVAHARGERILVALVAPAVELPDREDDHVDPVVQWAHVVDVQRRRGGLALRVDAAHAGPAPRLPADALAAARDGRAALGAAEAWPDAALPRGLAERGAWSGTARRVAELPPGYEPDRSEQPALAAVTEADLYGDLLLPPALAPQLAAAIDAGRHVILMGAPGTGKTTLALNLARAAVRAGLCSGYLLATATADWTTFDTIGGLVPAADGALRFAEGVALRALRENRWLLLDELNRADIDRAFGPLLTVLSGGAVELPAVGTEGRALRIEPVSGPAGLAADGGTYRAGSYWRIVATMNTLDRAGLFALSLAFARRFAFILVLPPAAETLLELVRQRTSLDERAVVLLRRLLHVSPRPLGPAIVLDAAAYVATRAAGAPDTPASWGTILGEALGLFIVPQFEGLGHAALLRVAADLAPALDPAGEAVLRQYIDAFHGEG